MHITIDNHSGIASLKIAGEVDSLSATVIKDKIQDQLEAKCFNIVIDLTQVRFMDSAGLGVMVSALKKCNQNGGDLVLVGVTKDVRELFKITRLDTVFKIFPDVESASKVFGPQNTRQPQP